MRALVCLALLGGVARADTEELSGLRGMMDGDLAVEVGKLGEPEQAPLTGPGEFDVRYDGDGTAHVEDLPNVRFGPRRGPRDPEPAGATVLSFDLGDALMRWRHLDPYAAGKLRELDHSRDARFVSGLRFRAWQLGKGATATVVQQNIARALASTRDPRAQRAALEALRDECATAGSAELVAAGTFARALIDDALARLDRVDRPAAHMP